MYLLKVMYVGIVLAALSCGIPLKNVTEEQFVKNKIDVREPNITPKLEVKHTNTDRILESIEKVEVRHASSSLFDKNKSVTDLFALIKGPVFALYCKQNDTWTEYRTSNRELFTRITCESLGIHTPFKNHDVVIVGKHDMPSEVFWTLMFQFHIFIQFFIWTLSFPNLFFGKVKLDRIWSAKRPSSKSVFKCLYFFVYCVFLAILLYLELISLAVIWLALRFMDEFVVSCQKRFIKKNSRKANVDSSSCDGICIGLLLIIRILTLIMTEYCIAIILIKYYDTTMERWCAFLEICLIHSLINVIMFPRFGRSGQKLVITGFGAKSEKVVGPKVIKIDKSHDTLEINFSHAAPNISISHAAAPKIPVSSAALGIAMVKVPPKIAVANAASGIVVSKAAPEFFISNATPGSAMTNETPEISVANAAQEIFISNEAPPIAVANAMLPVHMPKYKSSQSSSSKYSFPVGIRNKKYRK